MILTLQSAAAVAWGSGTLSVGPITITGTITPTFTNVTLASGANTVTVPTGAVGCVVTPPASNNQTLTLKGVTGDTGVKLPQSTPSLVLFDTANLPASFVITAGALTVGQTEILFF